MGDLRLAAMTYRIWSFWETKAGASRPEYLDLCEETWHRHCGDDFEITRVTKETAYRYVPDLIPEWDRLPVLAHKADYLRAALVHRYGGIWLDNDTIVLQNLVPMMERLRASGSDFIGCGRPGKRPSIGVFGGRAGCALLDAYLARVTETIRSGAPEYRFKWTELGYGLLWPLTREYDYFQYDFRVCIPVHPSRFRVFFEAIGLDEVAREDCDIRADTLTVSLYNAMFPAEFKRLSRAVLLSSDMLISEILRRALGRTSGP